MTDPLTAISTRATHQSEPIPGRNDQVENSAGGYVFAVDKWAQLDRFLILGTEGGTYYIGERDLTKQNAMALMSCIAEDGPRVVARIVEISEAGRAPKQSPTIFALAACAGASNPATRRAAELAVPRVCRIGTHLFMFAGYVEQFRGWGRGLRRAVGGWYLNRPLEALATQVVKYQQRGGWSHRDLLRLAHPQADTPQRNEILRWAAGKPAENLPGAIEGYELAKRQTQWPDWLSTVQSYPMTWEMLPSEALRHPQIWQALLPDMGMTALVRNLGRMTANGALKPLDANADHVAARLIDAEQIRRSRIHPIQVLLAQATYASGHGDKGSLQWQPIPQIIDALDEAFYLSFGNVESSGKRLLLALDVSGSMTFNAIAGTSITPRVASAAMAMVSMHAEEHYPGVMAFSGGFVPLGLSRGQRLNDVLRMVERMPFDRTDCSMPMRWARQNQVNVDCFVVYTDSETWAGPQHPVQALRDYRAAAGIDARLIVVGMTSNGFTIADPTDQGMLDVVGFDAATPGLIASFAAGEF